MFKFKTPRDNALFMLGMTFGATVGFITTIIISLRASAGSIVPLTALIMAITLGAVTFINYSKFKKLDAESNEVPKM